MSEMQPEPQALTSMDHFHTPEISRLYDDLAYPSVELLTAPTSFTGEKLDRSKGNYKAWRRSVREALGMCGLIRYTSSDASPPDAALEPRANANWHSNDQRASWFITSTCSHAEQDVIEPPGRGAAAYWKEIEGQHMPNEQVNLIKDALSLRVTDEEPWEKTLTKAYDMVDQAWSMGPISLETMKQVLAFYILEKSTVEAKTQSSSHKRSSYRGQRK